MSLNNFMKEEGLETLDQIEDKDGNITPYFSWSACDACNSNVGGDRYDCHGYHTESKEVIDGYSICPDCIWEFEYGIEDVS